MADPREAVDAIAAVQRSHSRSRSYADGQRFVVVCGCGEKFSAGWVNGANSAFATHRAAALMAALPSILAEHPEAFGLERVGWSIYGQSVAPHNDRDCDGGPLCSPLFRFDRLPSSGDTPTTNEGDTDD